MADLLGVTRYQIPYPGLLWPMFSLFDSSPRYESTRVVDDFAKDKRSFWSHYATQLNANRRNCSPAGSFAALIETRCQFFGHLSLFLVHSFPQFLWGILC